MNIFELIVYGRGGQGAKTSAELIVQAALESGKQVQAFPEFGPERSGAPVKSFVRISELPIRTHEPISSPDCLLILDETILEAINVFENFDSKNPVIINSKKSGQEFVGKFGSSGKIITIDASGISMDIIGENRPNTVILGKFCFVTEVIDLEELKKAFKEKYQNKLGNEKVRLNIEAMEKAYHIH